MLKKSHSSKVHRIWTVAIRNKYPPTQSDPHDASPTNRSEGIPRWQFHAKQIEIKNTRDVNSNLFFKKLNFKKTGMIISDLKPTYQKTRY